MATPTPIAKVSIGKSGYGAAHASYITRMSALDPDGRERQRSGEENRDEQMSLLTRDERTQGEPNLTETLDENLNDQSLDQTKEHGGAHHPDADPVWTWNAPEFLTDDRFGTRPELRSRHTDQTHKGVGVQDKGKLTIKEKVQNVRDYFGSLEEYERRKGGRTHYRIILSFDVPATNQQIRNLTNSFLDEAFPKAIAFATIHRDTDHPHVHLYLNSRQYDGRRIQLKNNEFKTIDEKWATIYAAFAGDKSVYLEYLRKKEETKQWKIAAAEAYRKGEPIPPKPERDNDRRERLAEQRLSAQRSQARDGGKQLSDRPDAQPVMRPGSEKETSRLLAKTEVAREELAHLIRNEAPATQVKWAARTAHEFAVALEKTLVARREMGKEKVPHVVYTTEERKQLKEYAETRDLPVKDDRAAARLQSTRVLAGAEQKDAQAKVDAFQTRRHFWKFHVEGFGKVSLREVEQKIKIETEDKFKLYNFLRPTKREAIQLRIEFLEETKKDIQKQIASAERPARNNLAAYQPKYETASKLVEYAEKARAQQGREMPLPVFERSELAKMSVIANRNRDAKLLEFVYHEVKDSLLANQTPLTLSEVKGKALMARMDMLKAADRLKATVEYGDYRQLPVTDTQGLTYTTSVREIEPKSALETLIRHFTDSPEKKRERQAVADARADQLRMTHMQSRDARDYSVIRDRIAQDFYRAAGVREKAVAPTLGREQIAELNKYADTLPFFSTDRKEFNEAARTAEESLLRSEASEAARKEAEQLRTPDFSARTIEQSPSHPTSNTERSDRNSYSRGR
jgi:hypothetical protein